jgi:hypothetical protein
MPIIPEMLTAIRRYPRRRVIRDAVLWATGAATFGPALLLTPDVKAQQPPKPAEGTKPAETKPPTQFELLKAAGLEDFSRLYDETSECQRIFGTTLYEEHYYVLEFAVRSMPYADMNERARLRDGWGGKKAQARDDAKEKVKGMDIDISETPTQDTKDGVRALLNRFAEYFPALIMASPNRVKTLLAQGGGYIAGDEVAFSSLTYREQAPLVALHEFTHGFEHNWEATKPYIDRKGYAEYAAKKAHFVKETFEKWLNLPWDHATTYRFLQPLLRYDYPDNEDFKKLIDQLEAQYGTQIDIPLDTDPEKAKDYVYRYNRLAHYLGRQMVKTAQKRKDGQILDKNEVAIRQDSNTIRLMKLALQDINHLFVDPVVTKYDELTSNITDLFFGGSYLHTANEQIQETRLRVYSLLPPNASFADLRRALGLQPATGPRYVAGENNRSREEMRTKELFGLLTRFGFRPIMEFPMKESQPGIPGYRLYGAPPNPFAPHRKTVLIEFLQEPKLAPLLVEIPGDKFSSDFGKWRSKLNLSQQPGRPANLVIDIPNNPSVAIEIIGEYAQTTDPQYFATVLLNKPTTDYIDEETLYAPFVVKRGTIDFRKFGTPSAGNVAYRRDGTDAIDIFPLPENIRHRAYSLHFSNNSYNSTVVEDKTTGKFFYIPNGRLLTERNSGHFTANLERPGVLREGGNRFSFNIIEPWRFSVPDRFLQRFADLTGQERGDLRFNYRLVPTKHESENPNDQPQVRYILEAQDRVNPNLKTRFPVYVTADTHSDLTVY